MAALRNVEGREMEIPRLNPELRTGVLLPGESLQDPCPNPLESPIRAAGVTEGGAHVEPRNTIVGTLRSRSN